MANKVPVRYNIRVRLLVLGKTSRELISEIQKRYGIKSCESEFSAALRCKDNDETKKPGMLCKMADEILTEWEKK